MRRRGRRGSSVRSSVQPWVRRLAWAHACTRACLGLILLLAPRRTAETWLGPGVSRAGGKVALQAFAVRDAALGYGIMRGLARAEPVRHWFRVGLCFEVVDAGATLLRRRELPDTRTPDAWALLGAAGLVGGAVVAVLLEETPPDRERRPGVATRRR